MAATEILPWEQVACEECGRKFVPPYSDICVCQRCAKARAQLDAEIDREMLGDDADYDLGPIGNK